MHGLVNRALQCFLRDSFGPALWAAVAADARLAEAGVGPDGFEPMLHYDPVLTHRLIDAATRRLERPRAALLEDLGTYLVSHHSREGVRRLLRFGGVGFADFLHSLDDLPGRVRLAVPDLELPQLTLRDLGLSRFRLECEGADTAFVPVLAGLLRAIADDYGALVLIEADEDARALHIDLMDQQFASGRRFHLGAGASPAPPAPKAPAGRGARQASTAPGSRATDQPGSRAVSGKRAGKPLRTTPMPLPVDPCASLAQHPVLGLPQTVLDLMMPLHLRLAMDGRILGSGPTLARLAGGSALAGRCFFDVFRTVRPRDASDAPALLHGADNRLRLSLRAPPHTAFKGLIAPLAGEDQALVNLSFGIGLISAVDRHGLTDADFPATDLAVEMLYLVEAKAAVLDELRRLNHRLDRARSAAEARALSDPLTGLANRRGFDHALTAALADGDAFALMQMDLDLFKQVNDSLGHAAGDHVLCESARILREETRGGDLVARLGGDEFAVILRGVRKPAVVGRIARRMLERIAQPMRHDGRECRVGASLGFVLRDDYDRPTAGQMQQDADEALYAAKRAGRGQARHHRGGSVSGRPAPRPPSPVAAARGSGRRAQ